MIDAAEEARLVREAVFAAAGGRFAPRVIVDLGGGSLEVSFLRGRKVTRAMAMPLGAVRLMEMFDLAGSFTPDAFARVRRRVLSMLDAQGTRRVREPGGARWWPAAATPRRWRGWRRGRAWQDSTPSICAAWTRCCGTF